MEGDPEESDEDVQGEGRPTVLWERCIQQSIFVDLSEDESLHLSDLESSLARHLSHAESAASEASIHLSGSEELSALDVSSSESSIISRQCGGSESKNKNRKFPVSPPRPDNMQDEPRMKLQYEDSGQNTSDEEQDDLPYDGDLGSSYFNQTAQTEEERSSDGRETVHASPDDPGVLECKKLESEGLCEGFVSVEKLENLLQEDADVKQENLFSVSKPAEVTPSCPADINQVLLRHFSQDELQQPGRLLEAETLPEVSLLESVDETVLSLCPAHNSTAIVSDHSVSHARNSEVYQSFCTRKSEEKSNSTSRKSTLEEEVEGRAENVTSASDSITFNSRKTNSKEDASAVDEVNQEKAQQDDQVPRAPFLRTRSFTEMKYGQGQVHYPLPDFSKVSPKVKIPKAPTGQNKPAPQSSSSVHRAQSSPGMLDLISRVMEDSIQPSEKPYVFRDEDKQGPPALVHHLQAEYDKLLTKYAEAENLIDQMRIGTNAQPSSELTFDFGCEDDHSENIPAIEESHPDTLTPLLPPSKVFVKKEETISNNNKKELSTDSSIKHEEGPSDGERMTAELKDIISQFMQNVEDFKLSINNMSMSTAEQQMMLRSLMEAQDQLERKYISKKEEHRALEMQNYMGLSRNTGTFDPHRLVEGDIFRIGMHIEDIKELIDKNLCEQISPPHSTSTPTPVRETQHEELSPLCMPTPSPPPPPPLLEGQSSGFSTLRDEMENDEEKKEGDREASEVGDDRLQQNGELVKTLKCGRSSCHSRSSQCGLDGVDAHTAETEDERSSVISDVINHSNILAYLTEFSPSSRQTQRTLDSLSSVDSVLHAEGECDQGDCFSLAVEVSSSAEGPRDAGIHKPPLNTSASQRIVSPETDSGFGSSYLNQSGTGSFQAHLFTEGVQSQHVGLSSTDSEGSCSNLQTAIHSVSLSSQRWASPHPSVETQSCGGAAAVERWVVSTTKEPSVHLQGSELSLPPQLPDPISEPMLSVTMDIDERRSPLNSCSCNREAILALQSEVSRLKKDLEEGLVQLPHLAQKMDNLTSRYRKDRQERRPKTRPRTQHRLTSNSVCKPSSCRQSASNLSCSQVRIEDWISSDMDPSRSKDSGDLAGSEIMLQFHRPPAEGRGGSSMPPSPEFLNALHVSQESEKISSTKTSKLTSSYYKGGKAEGAGCHVSQRPQIQAMDNFSSKERWPLSSSPSPQKPLLQVNYGSSSSLPASYKVREPPLQSTSHHRKRSTQSDTALLPSNVYFQRTLSPVSAPSKTGSRAGRHRGSKEEEMSRTLDQAMEVALSMKRTTDRMAKRLSADLAKAKLHRRQLNMQPLGGRKHHAV